MDEQILFTPASLLDLLSQIDEIKDLAIGVTVGLDGELILQIGESTYKIEPEKPLDVEVEQEIVEDIAEQNETAYEELVESSDDIFVDEEVIEGGIYTETLKDILVGGLVRMAGKYLKKNFGNG